MFTVHLNIKIVNLKVNCFGNILNITAETVPNYLLSLSRRGSGLFETTSNYLKAGLRLAERFLIVAIVMSSPVLRMRTPCFLKRFSHLFNTMHAERQVFSKVFSQVVLSNGFLILLHLILFSYPYSFQNICQGHKTNEIDKFHCQNRTIYNGECILYLPLYCSIPGWLYCSQGSRWLLKYVVKIKLVAMQIQYTTQCCSTTSQQGR